MTPRDKWDGLWHLLGPNGPVCGRVSLHGSYMYPVTPRRAAVTCEDCLAGRREVRVPVGFQGELFG